MQGDAPTEAEPKDETFLGLVHRRNLRSNALHAVEQFASVAPHSVFTTRMSRVPAGLWKKFIAVQIYGANTDVGKTVFSTLLGLRFKNGLSRLGWKNFQVQYIKPVSTGPSSDRDDRSVHF